MLTARGLDWYQKFLKFGCAMYIFPYKWDGKTRRLLPGGKFCLFVFHYYFVLIVFATTFFTVRFLMTYRKGHEHFPLFAKVFNMIWLLSCFFTSMCIYQVKSFSQMSLAFHNTLIAHCESMLEETEKANSADADADDEDGERKRENRKKKGTQELEMIDEKIIQGKLRRYITAHVILQVMNHMSATPTHSVGIFLTPCSPNFISSVILPCETEGSSVPFGMVIPFFFYESLVVLIDITIWAFCWFGLFLGLSWIYWELKMLNMSPKKGFTKYRELQVIMAQMNRSFNIYLGYSSSMMFGLIAFAIYGTIRLFGKDWRAIVYVGCMIRCGFESITPLTMAGKVNYHSTKLIEKMKQNANDKVMRRQMKSIGILKTRAGSFYTFENSIVLTCLDNLIQLVLNLLIMF